MLSSRRICRDDLDSGNGARLLDELQRLVEGEVGHLDLDDPGAEEQRQVGNIVGREEEACPRIDGQLGSAERRGQPASAVRISGIPAWSSAEG